MIPTFRRARPIDTGCGPFPPDVRHGARGRKALIAIRSRWQSGTSRPASVAGIGRVRLQPDKEILRSNQQQTFEQIALEPASESATESPLVMWRVLTLHYSLD